MAFRRMLYTASLIWAASLAACADSVPAQSALDAKTRAVVIDSVAARLERQYIDLDTARLIGAALKAQLRAGAYDSLSSPARFAEVVTRHMRSVNNDRHLGLTFQSAGGPAGGAAGGADNARRQNFGINKVEVLPGNIGYLEIRGFMGQPGHEAVVGQAFKLLENTDAVIIDVRRNGGGSSGMSHLVFSHFLPAEPVQTIRVYSRATGGETVRESLAEVTGPRRPTVPLYVLTSQGTASAAEEFTFVLKNQRRATVVGDRTAGAGHMVNVVPVGHGFSAGISVTRVMDARSGLEWEGGGVLPDVRVPPENALDAAYATALRASAEKNGEPTSKRTLQRLAESVEARLKPVAVDAARLRRWVGAYDEGRSISYAEGKLWYRRRADVLPDELIPLGGDLFALAGAQRASFETRASATVLTIELPDGTRLSYARQAAPGR